jgi:hypothetical protein
MQPTSMRRGAPKLTAALAACFIAFGSPGAAAAEMSPPNARAVSSQACRVEIDGRPILRREVPGREFRLILFVKAG